MEEKLVFLGAKPCKQVCWINLDNIAPNPNQPRTVFDSAALEDLAASIRQHGLLQPITVRALDTQQYELVAGERRLRACRLLGMTHIDAIVVPGSIQDSALLALIENLQREDLHFFEEAEGFLSVLQAFKLSQEELATHVGKSQSAIANKLRLLRLEADVRQIITEGGLTERHARALLKLTAPKDRLEVATQAVRHHLNVRQTEALVEQLLERQKGLALHPQRKIISLMRDHRLYINAIRDIVQQMQSTGITADYTIVDMGDRIEMRVIMPRRRQAE